MEYPEKMDGELRYILSIPRFQAISIARFLRLRGVSIPLNAAEEQAAVIHHNIHLYLKHGKNWRTEGERIMTEEFEKDAKKPKR